MPEYARLDNSPGPQLSVETKFMQNFRVAAAVSGGSEVVAIRNGQGQVQIFTTGTDNTVWNFYPDPNSDTGYRGVSTGLSAGTVSAGVDSSGRIILFAPIGLQLQYIYETGNPGSPWSAPQSVSVPQPAGAIKIAAVMAAEKGGNLYVAVLTQYKSVVGSLYSVAYSNWKTSAPSFQNSAMKISSLNCAWVGNSAQTAAFACVDGVIVALNASTGGVSRWPLAAAFKSLSVDASVDATGNDQIFAVLDDGNLYHLIGGGQSAYSWAQLTQAMSLRQTMAVSDGARDVQVFAVSGGNTLYHFAPMASTPTGYSNAAAIFPNTALADAARNDDGDVEIFAIGTSNASLTHLIQAETTGNWETETLEVPTGTQVEQYISYTSDVTVYDGAGALAVLKAVKIWTSDEARITVNGATFFTSPNHPAMTSTNSAGILSIAQESGTLSCPAIDINIPALMSPNQSLRVEQTADVQQRLAEVTGTDLMNARDAGGNLLIPTQYRNAQTTDSMASAFNQCMHLAGSEAPATHSFFTRYGTKPGVTIAESQPAEPRRIQPLSEQHWRLSFASGQARYQELTADQAQSLIREWRATVHSPAGFFSWIESIGDLLEGVIEGIVDIVDTVVTAVGNAVQAAFRFIVDGVTYLFETVVAFVEQAFDVVQAFFARVGVIFEKVFEWLGFIFNWGDILRTHTALAYGLNQFLGFLPGAAAKMQQIVDNGISNVQSQITSLFDQAVSSIAGNSSVGGYEKSNRQSDPAFSSAVANNVVYNGFIDNAGSATTTLNAELSSELGSIQQWMEQLQQYVVNTEATQAFSQASDYFQSMTGSPDQIFTNLLSGLLRVAQGVLQAIISGVQALIDGLFQLIQSLLAGMQSLLNAKWNIPFVSALYSWITDGAELTTIDLFALVMAIPTTILYKVIEGVAPFPDDASVRAFEQSFNAQTMLQASGLGSTSSRLTADRESAILSPAFATLMNVAGCVSSVFYAGFSALLDAQPPIGTPTPLITAVSRAAFAAEALAQVCGFPWFTNSAAPDCSTTDGKNATHWIYQCFGVLLDLGFVIGADAIPENLADWGVGVSFLYAVGDLIMAIIASVGQSGWPVAGNILAVIPELTKLGRLTKIVTATKGISLVVVAGCDAVFMFGAALINFVEGLPSSEAAALVTAG
jgi:hypothetical protein